MDKTVIHRMRAKIRKKTFSLRSAVFYRFVFSKLKFTAEQAVFTDKTILIISPHADDEYVGCAGFMFQNRTCNTVCAFLCSFLGGNKTEQNRKIRENEYKLFCEQLRLDYRISNKDVVGSLKKYINEIKPQYILLPSIVDPHYEHRQINLLLSEVLSGVDYSGGILWYSVTLPIDSSFLNRYVPLSEEEDQKKWSCFSFIYPSQSNIHVERFRAEERFLGRKLGTAYAEGYLEMTYEQWANALNKWENRYAEQLDRIKKMNRESCLSEVYRISSQIYTNLL